MSINRNFDSTHVPVTSTRKHSNLLDVLRASLQWHLSSTSLVAFNCYCDLCLGRHPHPSVNLDDNNTK